MSANGFETMEVNALATLLAPLTLQERLSLARRRIAGRLVFTTSFGLEDQAIVDAIFTQKLAIEVVTLDTGRLFPETYDTWARTEAQYGRRIAALAPDGAALETLLADGGVTGFRHSVKARQRCCGVRKVVPLGRALEGAQGWITGLRSEQSANRIATPLAAYEPARALIKLNPLADWSRSDLEAHIMQNGIPYNVLHDRGFVSVGCAPCTRAIRLGEAERAGRWWWEDDARKECGLHNRPAQGTVGEHQHQ